MIKNGKKNGAKNGLKKTLSVRNNPDINISDFWLDLMPKKKLKILNVKNEIAKLSVYIKIFHCDEFKDKFKNRNKNKNNVFDLNRLSAIIQSKYFAIEKNII